MTRSSRDPMKPAPYWRLWLVFFAYTALVALFVQLFLLPILFPAWHAGDGMLAGGDWPWFHHLSVELAQRIRTQGWSAWELRPAGQAPAGIAGAIYALTVPKPWTIIPINAALHATAALLLLKIIRFFLPQFRFALVSVLPFVLYPSSMIWYTQIHKDGYSIAGFFLFMYGWGLIARQASWRQGFWSPLRGALYVFLGTGLIWIVRPYVVQMLQGLAVLLSIGLAILFLTRAIRSDLPWKNALAATAATWLLVVSLSPLTTGGIAIEEAQVIQQPSNQDGMQATTKGNTSDLLPQDAAEAGFEKTYTWVQTGWLPARLEDVAFSLAISRARFPIYFPEAKSNIDTSVMFHSFSDILRYMPRAMQIAFLSPFPSQWFEQGSLPANTVMRRVSGLEMMGIYLSFLFLPYGIWRWRRRIELWIILALCTGMMLFYGLVVANIGTLYRMRYGYIMTLVALAIAGVLAFWVDRRQTHKKDIDPQETL